MLELRVTTGGRDDGRDTADLSTVSTFSTSFSTASTSSTTTGLASERGAALDCFPSWTDVMSGFDPLIVVAGLSVESQLTLECVVEVGCVVRLSFRGSSWDVEKRWDQIDVSTRCRPVLGFPAFQGHFTVLTPGAKWSCTARKLAKFEVSNLGLDPNPDHEPLNKSSK